MAKESTRAPKSKKRLPKQIEAFKKTARELGLEDEPEEAFDKALRKVERAKTAVAPKRTPPS
jgi:hypothetical protein